MKSLLPLAAIVRPSYATGVAEGKKAAQGRPGAKQPGLWERRPIGDEPGPGLVIKKQAAHDYGGASYELRARHKRGRVWAYGRVDWPPGRDTLRRPGTGKRQSRRTIRLKFSHFFTKLPETASHNTHCVK